jgi:hypothetical protein
VRPLGELFCHFQHLWPHISSSHEENLVENATDEVRYEAYRALYNGETGIDNGEVLRSLSNDLMGCEKERHIEFVSSY